MKIGHPQTRLMRMRDTVDSIVASDTSYKVTVEGTTSKYTWSDVIAAGGSGTATVNGVPITVTLS